MKTNLSKALILMIGAVVLQSCGLSEEQKREFFQTQKATQDSRSGLGMGTTLPGGGPAPVGAMASLATNPTRNSIATRAQEVMADLKPEDCKVEGAFGTNSFTVSGDKCPYRMAMVVTRAQFTGVTATMNFSISNEDLRALVDVTDMDLAVSGTANAEGTAITVTGQGKIVSRSRGTIPLTVEGNANQKSSKIMVKMKFEKFTAELEQETTLDEKNQVKQVLRLNGEEMTAEKIQKYMDGDAVDFGNMGI